MTQKRSLSRHRVRDRGRCIVIGTAQAAAQLCRQLQVLDDPPCINGVFLHRQDAIADNHEPFEELGLTVLGTADDLCTLIDARTIDYAIVTMPSVLSDAITHIRTTLRRIGVPERFIATLQDHLDGIGPRTLFEVSPVDLIGRPSHPIDEDSIRQAIAGRKVLITGAGGSIGSEMAMQVASYGPAEMFLMERAENALFEIDRRIARRYPGIRRGVWLHDVANADKTLAYCEAARPDIVFHTAAHKHVPMLEDHPREAVRNNFFGTMAIVDAAAQTACERFVMISTDKAVNPSSIMGATKRLAELYVQHMNSICEARFNMVRFGNVLGSNGSVLPIWAAQLRDGGPLTVTDERMTRYFMTIPEAASLVLQAASLTDGVPGDEAELYQLDMGQPVAILDLAKRFIEAHGLEPQVIESSSADRAGAGHAEVMPIVITGIRPGEKLHEQLVYESEQLIPTAHPAIRRWQAEPPCPERIADMVATLLESCLTDRAGTILTAIHRLLPEMETSAYEDQVMQRSAAGGVSAAQHEISSALPQTQQPHPRVRVA
ncbi:MAG: polysaccharide biosynthesis protein [Planctomycetes bacterium]|nr:polysaccharide biosynthesis protein [Planctomycetota bacterium]